VLFSQVWFRILYRNQAPPVQFGAERCYVLGEANDELLIYCPDRQPPRNQVVSRTSSSLHLLALPPESIFTSH
jgi:hypothetical protein